MSPNLTILLEGTVPEAFQARGNADMNVPDSVDWGKVLLATDEASSL